MDNVGVGKKDGDVRSDGGVGVINDEDGCDVDG